MSDLSQYSNAELGKELARREEYKKEEIKMERAAKRALALSHRDMLKKFMTHGRGSCATRKNNTYHPDHGGADCQLCCFEALGTWHDDVEVTVEVRLRRIKD